MPCVCCGRKDCGRKLTETSHEMGQRVLHSNASKRCHSRYTPTALARELCLRRAAAVGRAEVPRNLSLNECANFTDCYALRSQESHRASGNQYASVPSEHKYRAGSSHRGHMRELRLIPAAVSPSPTLGPGGLHFSHLSDARWSRRSPSKITAHTIGIEVTFFEGTRS